MSDENLISCLITTPTIRAAAKKAGVSESTIYTRLKSRAFCELLAAYRDETLRATVAAVQKNVDAAVQTIVAVMNDSTANPQQRLNAAVLLLKHHSELNKELRMRERSISADDIFNSM